MKSPPARAACHELGNCLGLPRLKPRTGQQAAAGEVTKSICGKAGPLPASRRRYPAQANGQRQGGCALTAADGRTPELGSTDPDHLLQLAGHRYAASKTLAIPNQTVLARVGLAVDELAGATAGFDDNGQTASSPRPQLEQPCNEVVERRAGGVKGSRRSRSLMPFGPGFDETFRHGRSAWVGLGPGQSRPAGGQYFHGGCLRTCATMSAATRIAKSTPRRM